MEHNAEFMEKASLGDKLEAVIMDLPKTEVTLAEILDSIGHDSLLFLTIFLSLVFLVPVSIPGVSTVFGSAILLIGISRLIDRKLWLPRRIANRTISSDRLIQVFNRALIWFRRLEKLSRPYRFQLITSEGKAGLFNKISYIFAAGLLMVPFGFVPFSNTLPAITLIFLSVGEMQKDGRCIFIGHLSNLVTVIYFSALVAGGGMTIYEVVRIISGS
ncbi:MAG TPA: exopolysaccharide biosynthesis protein [Levilinea sp.]|nr:exopolysaccharide biosynthesis protein [Levilinea sp.]